MIIIHHTRRTCVLALFYSLALSSFTLHAADAPAAASSSPAAPAASAAAAPAATARPNTAIIPSLSPGFVNKHNANVEIAKKGDIDVLFMGDSITDFWRNAPRGGADPTAPAPMSGKVVFDKYFGSMKVANFGIAGDTTQGVLFRLQNGEGQGFQPKVVMLMIGTNNTGRNTAEEIAAGITADVKEMRKDFPNAKILLLAVFPRGLPGNPNRAIIDDINWYISKLSDLNHVFYMDIGPKFLDDSGTFLPGTFTAADGFLHPTSAGYQIWAEAVKDPIANLMKLSASTP